MSQKEKRFQSKPRVGGKKFDGPARGAPRGRPRPEGRSFSERKEGDSSDRPQRSAGRPAGRPSSRPTGRSFDRDARPPRREGSDSRPPRREYNSDRPARPPRDGDSAPRSYQKRNYADRKPREFGERKNFGERPARPARSFDDRPPRREYNSDRPARSFDSRPPRDRDDRPRKSFGDKPYGDKKFGDKKPFRKEERKDTRFDGPPQRTHKRYEEQHDFHGKPSARDRLKSDRPSYGAPSSAFLYGVHAVTQALLNPKRIHQRLICTEKSFAEIEDVKAAALENGVTLPEVIYVEREDIDRLLPRDAVHQDLLLDCQPLEDIFLVDLLQNIPEQATVLVLDQVTDPHNVGAIMRSAAAFGAIAVIMQKLHAPEITGTLAKSASGAVEHIPLVREVNLSRALEQLKEAGFFCIGLAEEGKRTLAEQNLSGRVALVLGAEGSGLRRLVAENCDELVKLPTQEPIGSLNVSNAAAVALYELARK